MKAQICIIFFSILIPCLVSGQRNPSFSDLLYAEVHGDTVILHDDSAFRNCGALYEMQFIHYDGYTYRWFQNDQGVHAYCYCYFNNFVTIDSLKPGNYEVHTYYTNAGSSNTIYIGTIYFKITKPSWNENPTIIDEGQSDCHTVGLPPSAVKERRPFVVYPNPGSGKVTLDINETGTKKVEVFDPASRCIFQQFTEEQSILVDTEGWAPQTYFIRVTGLFGTRQTKFVRIR